MAALGSKQASKSFAKSGMLLNGTAKHHEAAPIRTAPTECPSAPPHPSDRRANKSRLSIAQYNVDWLFLAQATSTGKGIMCPRPDELPSTARGCCEWSATGAAAHLRAIALDLLRIDADIVHLAEVEDCFVLRTLLDQLPPGHGYKPYLLFGRDAFLGQNVGLITRVDPMVDLMRDESRASYPVEGSRCGFGGTQGLQGVSKHVLSRFQVDGLPNNAPLTLIGAHLLSQRGGAKACAKREAQALVLAKAVRLAAARGDHIVLLGDFNDFDNETRGTNSDNYPPKSDVLHTLKTSLTPPLENALSRVADTQRFSEWWDKNSNCVIDADDGELSLLDHVLVSSTLAAHHLEEVEMLHDIPAGCPEQGIFESDHFPIKVTFASLVANSHVTVANYQGLNMSTGIFLASVVIALMSVAWCWCSRLRARKRHRLNAAEHVVENYSDATELQESLFAEDRQDDSVTVRPKVSK